MGNLENYHFILPVIFYEFLAISVRVFRISMDISQIISPQYSKVTRAILPKLLVEVDLKYPSIRFSNLISQSDFQAFGDYVYYAIGVCETIKGYACTFFCSKCTLSPAHTPTKVSLPSLRARSSARFLTRFKKRGKKTSILTRSQLTVIDLTLFLKFANFSSSNYLTIMKS